jgi:hypothetical protein
VSKFVVCWMFRGEDDGGMTTLNRWHRNSDRYHNPAKATISIESVHHSNIRS